MVGILVGDIPYYSYPYYGHSGGYFGGRNYNDGTRGYGILGHRYTTSNTSYYNENNTSGRIIDRNTNTYLNNRNQHITVNRRVEVDRNSGRVFECSNRQYKKNIKF